MTTMWRSDFLGMKSKYEYRDGTYVKVESELHKKLKALWWGVSFPFKYMLRPRFRRHIKYINYWNSRVNDIKGLMEADRLLRDSVQVYMSWTHLIDQEICMWNRLGYVSDFDYLAKRRGFNADQQLLMREIIQFMGLKYKNTERSN